MKIVVTPNKVESLLASLGRMTAGKMILADELTEEEAKAIAGLFQPWAVGEVITQAMVDKGVIRQHEGELYKCNIAHTTQADWAPGVATNLWTVKSAPGVIPVWIQPTSTETSYAVDYQVQWPEGGTVWKSTIPANTTVPGENLAHGYWVEVTS